MKIKVIEYRSMNEFEQDENSQGNERLTVVRENGWIKADLLTECKSWKTAVRRFFANHPDSRVIDDWQGCMTEGAENGFFKDSDYMLANGTKNEFFSYCYEIEEVGDGLWYIFLNVSEDRYEEPTAAEIVERIAAKVEQTKTRSAWDRGVKAYAEELCEELTEAVSGGYVEAWELSNRRLFEKAMLNGAQDWRQYSEGGCSLCYDGQIAERLCAPWELRKTDNGRKDPNPRETWIDVQSRALFQAAQLVLNAAF